MAETIRTVTELELDDKEETIEFAQNEMKSEMTMKKGEDVVFTVPFKSTLAKKPTVTWMFKSSELKTSEKIITTITKKSASITIKHVESLDCGIYTCKLHNSVSDVSVDFNLTVIDKPSPPRGPVKVTWKTEDTLRIEWIESESDGGAKIEEYIVERKEVGKKSWKQVSSSSQLTTEILGLKRESSYNFRVIARNIVGCSEALNIEETFTAAKAEIKKSLPGSPSVSVTDVTSRSVTLQWNPPSNTGGVHLSGYIIEKRLSSTETWERVVTVESSITSFTVENLKEKSEFYFRVSAENEVGVGESSMTEKVSLKTHATPPSPPTAPLEIVPLGPHSLTVSGAPRSLTEEPRWRGTRWPSGTPRGRCGWRSGGSTLRCRNSRSRTWRRAQSTSSESSPKTRLDLATPWRMRSRSRWSVLRTTPRSRKRRETREMKLRP